MSKEAKASAASVYRVKIPRKARGGCEKHIEEVGLVIRTMRAQRRHVLRKVVAMEDKKSHARHVGSHRGMARQDVRNAP